ncbi:helix-turn-helix domain-containing protein [Helicobacter sp. MIT 14-3879]|uniref:winged helix-turn-helix transcriptional regulator n=1 Tax=Helicobacter sp. MIT 14-3879 TaxID=2040649 RepID=UPI000E1F206E|nr:helix-turn-helix domain-containing protein [Helicobacter sp. MIT 14-3879]RDU58801.1 transcriptional regulator [Helicobacter sp. MIT 14-3879]
MKEKYNAAPSTDDNLYKTCLHKTCLEDSPFAYTLSLISGKYKMSILYCLFCFEVVRYNEMKRYLSGISFKTLTNALKELEADSLIQRKEYPQIPPKVEYSLSPRGQSLIPILDAMCEWGKVNKENL